MSDDDLIQQLCQSNISILEKHIAMLVQIFEEIEDEQRREDDLEKIFIDNIKLAKNQSDYLNSIYRNFVKDEQEMNSTYEKNMLSLIFSVSTLSTQIDLLDMQFTQSCSLTSPMQKIALQWNKLILIIKAAIKTLSTGLWQLICKIMTPKGWSVSGNANVNFFGLGGGNVKIQVNFGSP